MTVMEDERRKFIAKRVAHGAETPIGYRCSTAVCLLENIELSKRNYERTTREIEDLEFAELL